MIRFFPFAIAGLVATTFAFGVIGANAQAPPASQPASGTAGGPSADQPAEGMPWPVLIVTSVEVLRSSRAGGMDIVRARGLTTSSVWGAPHLVPITKGNAIDGTLDLIFQGVAPPAPGPMGPFMEIEAILPVEVGHPYKAVRVRSGTNAITLKTLPGYADVAAPKDDYRKIVGKYFLAKGATPPAGVASADVVREADMGWPVRVIRPTDGIPSYRLEPNRLTVVLSEDGRVADAAWD